MSPLLKNLAAVATVALTGVLLVADSVTPSCDHAARDVTFDVTESTCGANGALTIEWPKDACDLRASSADKMDLPIQGGLLDESADFLAEEGGWFLNEGGRTVSVPDAGVVSGLQGHRYCETERRGSDLWLACRDHVMDSNGVPQPNGTCQARLTPR